MGRTETAYRGLSPQARTIGLYMVLVASLCTIWVLFMWRTDSLSSRLSGDYARIAGDVVLLTCPYWFAGRRWRLIGMLMAPLACLILLLNLWYYNAWGDIIPPWALSYTENIDGDLVRATIALMKREDFFFVLTSLLPLGAWFVLGQPDWCPKPMTRWILVGGSLVIYGMSLCVRVRSIIVFNRIEYGLNMSVGDAFDELLEHPKIVQLASMQRGPIFHGINIIRDLGAMRRSEKPDKEELEGIARFLQEVPCYAPDSIFTANVGKNIVLIIVESLDGELIGKSAGGREVMPVLNEMIREEGCIFSTNVVSQVKYGRSIDGQLLINTGLLPPDKGVSSVSTRGSLPYVPSLPRVFASYDSYAIMATKGIVWSERDVAQLIGYEDTSTIYDYPGVREGHDADGTMFRIAIEKLADRKGNGERSPFIMELISGSMHLPYEDAAAEDVREYASVSGLERNYYTVASYFDECLGRFIQDLKELGIYEDTVVFIMSDHENTFEAKGKNEHPGRTFFGAFNCGHSLEINRTTGQVNIYPAIMEIMGQDCQAAYHGLGASLLSPDVNSARTPYGKEFGPVDSQEIEAYEIADEIWRFNFFEKVIN